MIRWINKGRREALPLIAIPEEPNRTPYGSDLAAWTRSNMDAIVPELNRAGAILFRGFEFRDLSEFETLATAFCPKPMDYVGGNSPRTKVSGHVYTATEYSKSKKVSLHSEASYLRNIPSRIIFFCVQPAQAGGETVLADSRRVLRRIDPAVRDRFAQRKVKYVNNLHEGLGVGRSWMDTFQTDDRASVEQQLLRDGYEFVWKDDGLRASTVAEATARHPVTGEEVWINQAEQWHPSALDPQTREELLSAMGDEDLPHNAFFGDGSPLLTSDLEVIRAAMLAEERVINWMRNDVLVCDNLLVMHGRQPYFGDRKVFVALG